MKQGRPVTVFIEYKGKRLSLRQLAKATGHKVATIEDPLSPVQGARTASVAPV